MKLLSPQETTRLQIHLANATHAFASLEQHLQQLSTKSQQITSEMKALRSHLEQTPPGTQKS